MNLTREEEGILNGEQGAAAAKAMEILLAIGKIFKAEKLIPVTSAQISGVSYKTIGDAGLEFLESFAKDGRVKIPSYLNPAGMDVEGWREMGIPKEFARKQIRIIRAYQKMGVEPTCTCTPYLINILPKKNEHVAWSESSAVVFANSALGARTNRESGMSALAAAIIGKTPCFGYHLDENRIAHLVVDVKTKLEDMSDFGALGIYSGRIAKQRVVAFQGIETVTVDEVKSLGAALAASGAVALFFIKDITDEWKVVDKPEKVEFTEKELKETKESLNSSNDAELMAVGCPHCSLDEIREIAERVRGKKLKRKLWVCTARKIKNKADKLGLTKIIEEAGGRIVCDTCMVVCPLEEMGFSTTAVNSGKAAHYLPGFCKQKVLFGSLKEILE
ncbi:MAG: aconitase X catalytic domain-containing protein [Candidatus Micrarchaeia archaeon]